MANAALLGIHSTHPIFPLFGLLPQPGPSLKAQVKAWLFLKCLWAGPVLAGLVFSGRWGHCKFSVGKWSWLNSQSCCFLDGCFSSPPASAWI